MTGRELIIHIMENNLEDETILLDGKLVGMLTEADVAMLLGAGIATVRAWYTRHTLDGYILGEELYILNNNKLRKLLSIPKK